MLAFSLANLNNFPSDLVRTKPPVLRCSDTVDSRAARMRVNKVGLTRGLTNKGLTSCRPEPSSRRHVNKEAYGLSSVHLKKKKKIHIQLL